MKSVLGSKFVFFALYFLILSVVFYDTRLPQDAYYYWGWAQHLQLSYFDGPPFIAYALRMYTMLFGQQEFILLSFSFLMSILTTWMLWRTATLFFDKMTADYAVLIWMLSPGILYFFTLQVSYNTVMIFFWSVSFYAFGNLILFKQIRHYYYCGLSFGCLLLAQYSGCLLLISLMFTCLYYQSYRFVFKNAHFYCAALVSTLVFSPVMIWNYQHHWVSFLFQLHHGFDTLPATAHVSQIESYLLHNLLFYNISLLALGYVIWKNKHHIVRSTQGVFLFPTIFVFAFFCVSAYFAPTQHNWSAPFFFTGSILLASYVAPHHHYLISIVPNRYKPVMLYCVLLFCGALIYEEGFAETKWIKAMLNCRRGDGIPAAVKVLAKNIPAPIYQNKPIFVEQYQLGSHLAYFLHPTPKIYAVTPKAHQYYFWWLQEKNEHAHQPLRDGFLYMSQEPLKTKDVFLQHCGLEKKLTTMQQRLRKPPIPFSLYIYDCHII